MRIVGVTSPFGPARLDFTVGHGEHPTRRIYDLGFVALQPLGTRLADGEIVVTQLIRPIGRGDAPPLPRDFVRHERDSDEHAATRQRTGAYAVVHSKFGVLGTVNSSLTGAPGTWALPGGGIDDGEAAADAVVREVFEESGQEIRITRLLTLDSDHWVGRSVTGALEDFHALRIIYGAECQTPSRPVVHDLGGSTERAGWVPWRSWKSLRWTMSSRMILARYGRSVEGQFLK